MMNPSSPPPFLYVVFGTFNRLTSLRKAVDSVRAHAGTPHTFVIVDGGSTDGSIEWLQAQSDVILIQQGELRGAVAAFNAGFARAVVDGATYVAHLNDDAELLTPDGLRRAVDMLEADARAAVVALEIEGQGFGLMYNLPYANFGVVRVSDGMAVARAQGDPEGLAWWNPAYKTYGADCEFCCWLYRLRRSIHLGKKIIVRHTKINDVLRKENESHNPSRADSKLFWRRWPSVAAIKKELRLGSSVPSSSKTVRLHIGSGDVYLQGWINVDVPSPRTHLASQRPDLVKRFATSETDYYGRHKDVTMASLSKGPRSVAEYVCDRYASFADLSEFENPGVSEILARHSFEHLSMTEAQKALEEMRAILVPGGVLRLDVPDTETTLKEFAEKGLDPFHLRHLLGPRTGPYGYHMMSYTRDGLRKFVEENGFIYEGEEPNIHLYPSLCLRFRKPATSARPGKHRLLSSTAHCTDKPGVLTTIDEEPFIVRRTYWINVPEGGRRGGHAHKTNQQIFVPLHGRIDVRLTWFDGPSVNHQTFELSETDGRALYVPALTSCDLIFSSAGKLLVLCSEPFDGESYVEDLDELRRLSTQ